MNNKLSLVLFLAVFFILSCGKKDYSEDLEPCPPIILPTKVSGTTNVEISYDDSFRVSKVSEGQKSMEISYGDHEQIGKIQFLDNTATAAKRIVVQAVSTIAGFLPEIEMGSYYEGDQLLYESRNTYTYTDELITKKQLRLDNNSSVVQKYTLKNGNIATFDNGMGKVYTYTYDDKRNPFFNRILKYRFGSVDFFSANSVVEVQENNNGIKTITKNTYTYNADGYPLTMKSTNSEGAVTATYKFEYKSLPGGCY